MASLPDISSEPHDTADERQPGTDHNDEKEDRSSARAAHEQPVRADRAENPRRVLAVESVAETTPVDDGTDDDPTVDELRHLVDEDEAAHARTADGGVSADEKQEPEADSPTAIREARDQPKEYAGARAEELQGQVPEQSRGWVTMGVGVGTDSEGGTRVVVGTSEARGYLREGVTLRPGEERSREPGHAEVSILKYMAGRDIVPSHIGAGRPICSPCADSVDAAGAEPASTLKHPREDDRR